MTRKTPPSDTTSSRVEPVIRFRNVHKSFRVGHNTIDVLKNISLDIYPQEFVIILGPSGSGKSTLLNHLLGLEVPTSGQVFLHGQNIAGLNANQIAKLRYRYFGIVFQKPDWIGSINVLQNVTLPLAINNVKGKVRITRAWEKLKEVDMADHALFPPTELSGGQQQKVALARALMNSPEVIVADEPTGNLDSVSASKVMNIFQELNRVQHKTIIMVTHNIDYIRFGSRTIYIRDGQVAVGADAIVRSSP